MSNIPQSPIDIETVIERRKRTWMKEASKRISLQERIGSSVPWWLIIVAGVLFALSAPHTARMFDQITPGFGFLAPFAVEFGLLYSAFRRKTDRQSGEKIPFALWALEILLFFTAVVVNGAGSLIAVTDKSSVQAMSISQILAAYFTLPIMLQVGLLLAGLAAFIIPVGTWAAGEGLAHQFLRQRKSGSYLEEKWRDVEREEIRRAFYQELIGRGVVAQEARRRAEVLSAGMTQGQLKALPTGDAIAVQLDMPKVSASSVHETVHVASMPKIGQAQGVNLDARDRVRQYLKDNPSAEDMSVRELGRATGVSKSLAHEELQAHKASHSAENLV